ncbi:MAG TPA: hypothetical protein PKY30_16885, partial [Myxococcota bacterium]|nr:hypothetical protein [Myxococcota bacterium]
VDSAESLDLPVQAEKIFVSADGSLSVTTRAADLYHRRPADTAWRYIAQLPAPIAEIVEDAAAESTLLLGTHDGIWRLGDLAGESPTLERWGAWERVDGGSDFIRWSPAKPSVKVEEEADFGELHPLRAGAELRVWLRGSRLQIRGTSEVGARALLRLDGEPVATLEHDGKQDLRVLWSSEELAEGWHMLELVGVERGLAIDSLDGCTAPTEAACTVAAAPPPTPPPEKQDCGCQNGGAAWLWLGAIGLARRQSTQR